MLLVNGERILFFVGLATLSPGLCALPRCLLTDTLVRLSLFSSRSGGGKLARVAELADALASGASARKGVGVQVPPRARNVKKDSQTGVFFIPRLT